MFVRGYAHSGSGANADGRAHSGSGANADGRAHSGSGANANGRAHTNGCAPAHIRSDGHRGVSRSNAYPASPGNANTDAVCLRGFTVANNSPAITFACRDPDPRPANWDSNAIARANCDADAAASHGHSRRDSYSGPGAWGDKGLREHLGLPAAEPERQDRDNHCVDERRR